MEVGIFDFTDSESVDMTLDAIVTPKAKRRCFNNGMEVMDASSSQPGGTEFNIREGNMELLTEVSQDLFTVLMVRKIQLKSPGEVISFLQHSGVSPDEMIGSMDALQESIGQVRAVIDSSRKTESDKCSLNSAPGSLSAGESDTDYEYVYTSDSGGSLSSDTEGTSEDRDLAQQPLTSKAKSKYNPLTTKGRHKIETILQVPASIGNLLDDILNKIDQKCEEGRRCDLDIMPCWSMLTTGKQGERIKELLEAMVSPEKSRLAKIHELQKLLDHKETPMVQKEFDDLLLYLTDHTFNGGKVSFTFDDLSQFIHLKYSEDQILASLPVRLLALINDITSRTLSLRSHENVPIKTIKFMEMIEDGKLGAFSVMLLCTMVGKGSITKDVMVINSKLKKIAIEDLFTKEECSQEDDCRYITNDGVQGLKQYFWQYFFKKWLLTFSPEDLEKYMKRNGKTKLLYS